MRAAVVTVSVVLGFGAGWGALDTTLGADDHQFDRNIAQYIALRRQVEQHTPRPHISSDPIEISRAADAFADAIRTARPSATTCDIFTPAIARELKRQPCRAPDREDTGQPPAPAVNQRFDWHYAEAMPPALIAALPPLPDELQYRLVNCDLVLVDIEAGLVIDVVPRARLDRRRPH